MSIGNALLDVNLGDATALGAGQLHEG